MISRLQHNLGFIGLAVLAWLAVFPAQAQTSSSCIGIWVCPTDLINLPPAGEAWTRMKRYADQPFIMPELSNQDDMADVETLARALVYAKTGETSYRDRTVQAIMGAIGTEDGGETLALGRNLLPLVIAADVIGLSGDEDVVFREWLSEIRDKELRTRTLRSTHEDRPNNWGTHAGASRLAVAIYLDDEDDIERISQVFKGWVGDTSAYNEFRFRATDWQVDRKNPVGINPMGAKIRGKNVDGVLPDDQRRCCDSFTWPPPKEGYVWEAMQGVLAQAVMLHRQGYDVWQWEDRALLRAYRWMHTVNDYPAEGDDTWQPHLVNYYLGTAYPAPVPSRPGKNIGFTDWTHGPGSTVR